MPEQSDSRPPGKRPGLLQRLFSRKRQRSEDQRDAGPVAHDVPRDFGEDEDQARAELLHSSSSPPGGRAETGRYTAAEQADTESSGAASSREGSPVLIPREMFRINVSLPANLDVGGQKIVPVRITNISGTGAAIVYDSPEPMEATGHWLDLALPNRQKALALAVEVVSHRPHTGSQGEDQQILHVHFPTIRRNEQDAIIAYINNIRLYEDKQYSVAAKVMLEVVTGRRRFARFNGETIEIRPDMMRLMMDDFDAIAGAEVMLTVMAPHFIDHLDVEDVKIEKVEVVDPRKAEVEVSLAKPDDQVLLFIRKHYPSAVKSRR